MKVLYLGSNEKKNPGKEMNKIEARFSKRKQKSNSLKVKCENVRRKLNNMQQVQIEYWKMYIWKINQFNFLNEEVEEFTSRWSQNKQWVNVRSPVLDEKHL